MIDRVAIIGVGLIGGSFGMALKSRHLAGEVIGIGRNPERLKLAVELGAVDSWSDDLEAVSGTDLVYISVPVGLELRYMEQIIPYMKPGSVITDAGSTKAEICRGADRLMPDGVFFVGAHPMAGSEATGVEAAVPDLFVNAACVLTPTERTDPQALDLVRRVSEAVGSRVIEMDPESHDRAVAVISHLPHLLAAALASLAGERSSSDPRVLELVAGSFKDMTRVAGSSPVLWRDICLSNADALRAAASEFGSILQQGLDAVSSGNPDAVESWFASARRVKDSITQE